MKRIFIYAVMGTILFSCSKFEPELNNAIEEGNYYSVPILMEPNVATDNKSYLSDDGYTWKFVWEDADKIGFFQYRRSNFVRAGEAEVNKTPDSIDIMYPTGFTAGDNIYSYFKQPAVQGLLDEYGLENNDASNLYVYIPEEQISTYIPEEYNYLENFVLATTKQKVDKTSKTISNSPSTPVNTIPESRTVSFKINNYDSSLLYRVDGAGSNLIIDGFGNASATVSFTAYTSSDKVGTAWEKTATVNLYVDGHNTEAESAKINVKARATVSTSSGMMAGKKTYKTTIQYSVTNNDVSLAFERNATGSVKPYPIRDCMPIASKHYAVSYASANNSELIQNSVVMYMLGSAIQFRVYTTNEEIGIGDNLVGAIFTADQDCAGMCSVNLLNEDLELEGMGSNSIQSYYVEYENDEAITMSTPIYYGSGNYKAIDMVLAPGTYNANICLVGENYVYLFDISNVVFERGQRVIFNCNLGSANCTVMTIDDYMEMMYPEDPGEEPEEPDQPQQPEERDYGVNLGEFNLLNSTMQSYFSQAEATYNDSNYNTISVFNTSSFPRGGGGDLYDPSNSVITSYDKPAPVTIPLSGYNGQNVSVSVFTDAEKQNVAATVSGRVQNNTFEVYNLIPGKTYWYIATVNGATASYGYFNTVGQRRIIKVSDTVYADNANNCRDLGGQVTSDGKTLKYGKIFRGTNMDATTAAEKAYLTNDLNIRLDVDLRANKNSLTRNQAKAALDQSIVTWNHENISGRSDLESGKDSNNNYKIANIFNAIVNTLDNGGAVYIHCFAGADRTGYVCMLLEAVCGVSLSDCTMDYELTSFSCVGVRDRCGNLKNGSDILNNISFINNKSGANYKAKAEQVLRSSGVSAEQIAKFRSLMTE